MNGWTNTSLIQSYPFRIVWFPFVNRVQARWEMVASTLRKRGSQNGSPLICRSCYKGHQILPPSPFSECRHCSSYGNLPAIICFVRYVTPTCCAGRALTESLERICLVQTRPSMLTADSAAQIILNKSIWNCTARDPCPGVSYMLII